jgi:hypothetical protein
MTIHAKAKFQIAGWDEKTYDEIGNGAKLTQAKVTQTYEGAIKGTSSVEYLMSYAVDGTASFVGLEKVTGEVDGKSGTFVIQHVGSYSDGAARSSWSVLPGAGTGELANLRGEGGYGAGHSEPGEVSLSYSFEPDN